MIFKAGFYGVMFTQSLYFQQLRGQPPVVSGLLFLPMTALVAALSPLVPRVSARFGLRAPITGGQALMTAGLIALSCAPASTPLWPVSLLMIPVGSVAPSASPPSEPSSPPSMNTKKFPGKDSDRSARW